MDTATEPDASPADESQWPRTAVAVAALIAVGLAVWFLPVEQTLREFLAWMEGIGVWGGVAFVGLYIVGTVAFLPGAILTLGAGYAFGVVWGLVLVSIASTIGAALAFLIGRYAARDWVRSKIASRPKFRALDRALERDAFKVVGLVRLVPIVPFNALNYGFGVSGVGFWPYVLGSWLGMLPGTLMYVYFGSLAEKATRLAAGTPERQVAIWEVGETVQRLLAGNFGGGVLQNLLYWLGLVATVAVATLITRRARAELDRLTEGADTSESAGPDSAPTEQPAPPEPVPDDPHNRRLVANVHPEDWENPTVDETYNFVAIGAGTAGLVGAAGASSLGARAAIIEREYMGGDCLVSGCVPSKSLIRAARAVDEVRNADRFGIHVDGDVRVEFDEVMERMRRVRADISAEDSAERFDELGADVYLGDATFTGERTLRVGDRDVRFEKALIATGGRPSVPPIEGLEEAGYLTNETIFSLTELPDRLAVVGGGPIGCELAQAFARFGADVTVVEMTDGLLPNEDDEASRCVERALREDGVDLRLGTSLNRVDSDDTSKRLDLGDAGQIEADEILLAVGRTPNVEGLGLEAAGVEYDPRDGVSVDDRLQTSNSRIFAAGDVASPYKFTHVADAQARIALQNALFFGRRKASRLTIPWCTYTSPEVAHVGLYPDEARERGFAVETRRQELDEVDRARIDGDDGFLKVYLREGSDEILGATLVADRAGDLVSELTLAMETDTGLATIADTIHPYPTTAAVHKRAADAYNRTRLKPWMKSVLEWWFGLGH